MIDRPYADYRFMDDRDKDFMVNYEFHNFIDSVEFNRKRNKEPFKISTIIENDLQEHIRLQNFEACMLIRDIKLKYKQVIEQTDLWIPRNPRD